MMFFLEYSVSRRPHVNLSSSYGFHRNADQRLDPVP